MPGDLGPCGRVHGHNFEITLILESTALNENRMVVNALDLDKAIEAIRVGFDHRNLNEVLKHPTIESLAFAVFNILHKKWPLLIAVRIDEGLGIACQYLHEAHSA